MGQTTNLNYLLLIETLKKSWDLYHINWLAAGYLIHPTLKPTASTANGRPPNLKVKSFTASGPRLFKALLMRSTSSKVPGQPSRPRAIDLHSTTGNTVFIIVGLNSEGKAMVNKAEITSGGFYPYSLPDRL